MAINTAQLMRLYDRKWRLERLAEGIRQEALSRVPGRSVFRAVRSLFFDHRHGVDEYNADRAEAFAAGMARACLLVMREGDFVEAWDALDDDVAGDEADALREVELREAALVEKEWGALFHNDGADALHDRNHQKSGDIDGVRTMLADLYYCAGRLSSDDYWPVGAYGVPSSFLGLANVPSRLKPYDPDADGGEPPENWEPGSPENAGWTEWQIREALATRKIGLWDEGLQEWGDGFDQLSYAYALLRGCEIDFQSYDPDDEDAYHPEGHEGYREYVEDMALRENPPNPEIWKVWERKEHERGDPYIRWRDQFPDKGTFCTRYERFCEAWRRLGLPGYFNDATEDAFDLYLADQGMLPMMDTVAYGEIVATLDAALDRVRMLGEDALARARAGATETKAKASGAHDGGDSPREGDDVR